MPVRAVRIKRLGENRIIADIPYDGGAGPIEAKQIPGVTAKYDKNQITASGREKFLGWTYPLDIETCREMRRVFGDRLEISEDLAEWARQEVQKEALQVDLRSARDAALSPRVAEQAPALWAAFGNRPYQKPAVAFIREGRGVLIGDQPGLGKTLETLGALVECGARRVLVFCRKSAKHLAWQSEAERWLPNAWVTVPSGTLPERDAQIHAFNNTPPHRDRIMICVCNIEMMRVRREENDNGIAKNVPVIPSLFVNPWDAIVIDESHNALVGRSHLSKRVTQTRRGAVLLPVVKDGLRIALSGTPWRGKQLNSWGTLNWIRPEVFTSYWRYAQMYFDVEDGDRGGFVVSEEIRPDRVEDFDRMLAPYMLRRTKAEVAPDLPAKMYAGVPLKPKDPDSPVGTWLELLPPQEKAYADITSEGVTELAGGGRLIANGILAEMVRQKQFASCMWKRGRPGELVPDLPSNKLEWILDFLEARAGNDGKVVIASQFTKIINFFALQLDLAGFPNFVITGETSEPKRREIVRNFQNPQNPISLILVNTKAGGESITLDAADDMIFVDETSVPDDQEQMEDRIHRVSRIHPVTIYYLRSRQTIEEEICITTGVREGRVKERLDGSRGVEITRQYLDKAAASSEPGRKQGESAKKS